VVGHDDEAVKKETMGVTIAEECGDEAVGDFGSLKETAAVVGNRGDGVGLRVLPHGRRISQGLKPRMGSVRLLSGLKPGPISETRAKTSATTKASTTTRARARAKARTRARARARARAKARTRAKAKARARTRTRARARESEWKKKRERKRKGKRRWRVRKFTVAGF